MFEDNKLYKTDDPALAVIGSYDTLAGWRSRGTGPTYIKPGRRVLYRGSALNDFLDACTVETRKRVAAA